MDKSKKNKLLLVSGVSLLTVLGSTLAYFTTTGNVENTFKAGLYQNQIVEEFVSPSDWTPGTTTKKEISVKNTGAVSMAVRASIEESWVSANGDKLSLTDSDGNVASIINFDESWTKGEDGYYYYGGGKDNLTELKSGDTSTSLLKSVTFNKNIKATLSQTTSEDGKTISFTSTGDGYDNATYTLTIKIDTVQYDQANNVW